MNLLFRLFGIENQFLSFDGNVKKYGISKGSKILIGSLGLNIKVDLDDFPKKGATLVFSNHPTGLDPYILASVFGRDDFLFLGDIYQTEKGKNVAKHIAPIFPSAFWKELFLRRPTSWPGFINMRINFPPVKKDEARKNNQKAVSMLTDNLEYGHVSVVFPSGGKYEFLPWEKGLVYIAKEANRRKINFTIYRINFKYLSETKLLLHFLSGRKLFSNIKIQGYRVFIKDYKSDKLIDILKLL